MCLLTEGLDVQQIQGMGGIVEQQIVLPLEASTSYIRVPVQVPVTIALRYAVDNGPKLEADETIYDKGSVI